MTDFKYLSKAKIPKDPAEEMANMKDLYEKDPSDKTRECTIQEAMMMIMNICEENHIKKRTLKGASSNFWEQKMQSTMPNLSYLDKFRRNWLPLTKY